MQNNIGCTCFWNRNSSNRQFHFGTKIKFILHTVYFTNTYKSKKSQIEMLCDNPLQSGQKTYKKNNNKRTKNEIKYGRVWCDNPLEGVPLWWGQPAVMAKVKGLPVKSTMLWNTCFCIFVFFYSDGQGEGGRLSKVKDNLQIQTQILFNWTTMPIFAKDINLTMPICDDRQRHQIVAKLSDLCFWRACMRCSVASSGRRSHHRGCKQ